MDTNLAWQYTAVALLVMAALARLIWGIARKKDKGGSCCGCSLAETCRDYKRTKPSPVRETHRKPDDTHRCDCHK